MAKRITNTTAATAQCAAEIRRIAASMAQDARIIRLAENDPRNKGAGWLVQRRYDLENAASDVQGLAERARSIAAQRGASKAAKETASQCSRMAGDAWHYVQTQLAA